MLTENDPSRERDGAPCQTCGACCAFSGDWPRFTLEDDDAIERLPAALVADDGHGMRCHGDRCAALVGEVGLWTACAVYVHRPDVCRACEPGDEACRMARRHFGLDELPAVGDGDGLPRRRGLGGGSGQGLEVLEDAGDQPLA